MVGWKTWGVSLSLLEFSRDHEHELEVLSDEKAVFLLSFVNELGEATISGLASHLGWTPGDIEQLCLKLTKGGFAWSTSPAGIRATEPGRHLLRLLRMQRLLRQSLATPAHGIKVLLVEPHKIMRDGVKAIFRDIEGVRVIGEAETGPGAIQFCWREQPDLIIMEYALAGLNGIETTQEILRHWPLAKIMILSMNDDENVVVSAIRAGVKAFVLKKASDNDLIDAVRTVVNGGAYLSSQVSERLVQRIARGDLESNQPRVPGNLSPRELQVLRLVAEGKTIKEIAVLLDLGLDAVRSYRKTMIEKLSLASDDPITGLFRGTLPTTGSH
jgi:DNA-binding NarL/FixJ family response regulator